MKRLTTLILLVVVVLGAAAQSPGNGKWHKNYFQDDFNDPMYDHPYIEAELYNQYEHYFYIRFTPEHGGVFDFNLIEDFTHRRIFYTNQEPVVIQIKRTNGTVEKFTIPTNMIFEGTLYLPQSENLRFANAITSGNFKISITGVTRSSYPYSSTNVFTCTNQTRDFFNAARYYLGID